VVAMVWFGAIEREVVVVFTVLQGRLRRPFHPSDSEDENKEDLPSKTLFSVVPVGEKSLISLTTPGFDGPSPNPFPQMLLFQLVLVEVKPLPIVLWDGRARSPFIVEGRVGGEKKKGGEGGGGRGGEERREEEEEEGEEGDKM